MHREPMIDVSLGQITEPTKVYEFINNENLYAGMPDHVIKMWRKAIREAFDEGRSISKKSILVKESLYEQVYAIMTPGLMIEGNVMTARMIWSKANNLSNYSQIAAIARYVFRTMEAMGKMVQQSHSKWRVVKPLHQS